MRGKAGTCILFLVCVYFSGFSFQTGPHFQVIFDTTVQTEKTADMANRGREERIFQQWLWQHARASLRTGITTFQEVRGKRGNNNIPGRSQGDLVAAISRAPSAQNACPEIEPESHKFRLIGRPSQPFSTRVRKVCERKGGGGREGQGGDLGK